MTEQQITNELLRKLLVEQEATNRLLAKMLRRFETPRTPKQPTDPKAKDDQRIALAVVAIARGASTYQEIADELGVTRCTVSRNPGIRRAMEAAIRDRRPADREAAEEFKFERGR